MAEVAWTAEAESWLKDIHDYITADNSQAAASVVDGMHKRAQQLVDFPELGYRYQAEAREVRILLYGHYRITYLIKADGNVDILGVFHGALDMDRYLV